MRAPSSLILVTIDCLRADHVGFLGYPRPTTPFLDSLSGESFVFRNAVAAGAPTYYSLPAILASRYPLDLGRDRLGIAPEECTISSLLQESGFATAAFLGGNPYLSANFGYDQGFDVFCDFLDRAATPEPSTQGIPRLRSRANQVLAKACHGVAPLGALYDEFYFQYCQKISARNCVSLDSLRRYPSADEIVDQAIAWLKENCGRPFFLWLHLMDPHAPYFPKQESLEMMGTQEIGASEILYLNSYWNRGDLSVERLRPKREAIVALYDAGIRWADEQIRRLAKKLVQLNLWDGCALAVTADHGEEFLDHGGRFHLPLKLTKELVQVPLLLRIPGFAGGGDFSSPLSLLDLAPTLVDLLEIPIPQDFRGRSCWSQVAENRSWDRAVFTECVHGCSNPFRPENRVGPRILAVRKNSHKLIVDFSSGTEQLFDLSFDPNEHSPLPLEVAKSVRRDLLECAKKHVAESYQSRDIDRRLDSQLHDLRLEWAHPATRALN